MLLRSDLMVNMGNSMDAIDRAGAARQRAANDALLAQLQVLETRLKNLEDSNATIWSKSRHSSMKTTLPWVSVGTSKKNLACKDTCRKHHTLKASRHSP